MDAIRAALQPQSVADVQAAVLEHPKVCIIGGGTKPALTAHRPHATRLHMTHLTGIVEYDPGEYTITALAGTPLHELQATLARNGQHMPFDPPWIEAGATLGGAIAAGLSGSGRHRFGSLRDFIIGVRFIDGLGRLVRGGGKVVKNAAGFDLPKLMVGSRGEFGVLVEAGLKVFPEPPAYGTVTHTVASADEALALIAGLAASHFDLYALDLYASPAAPGAFEFSARLGGLAATIPARLEQLRSAVSGGALHPPDDPSSSQEAGFWRGRRELAWTDGASWLVKSACTLAQARRLEALLQAGSVAIHRLYTNAANSLWLAGTGNLDTCHALLVQANLSGVILRGPAPAHASDAATSSQYPSIGLAVETVFHDRIRQTLDPHARLRA